MANVSTRNYARIIPEMADSVGVRKSSVSRNFVERSGRELKRLSERRFEREFLVIYLDGVKFGEHHVLCAVGVDSEGEKVVLDVKDGTSENGATTFKRCRNHKIRNVTSNIPEDHCASRPNGCDRTIPTRRPVLKKVWKNCLLSIGSSCRLHCDSAWKRRTSSKGPTPEFVSAHAGSVDGGW